MKRRDLMGAAALPWALPSKAQTLKRLRVGMDIAEVAFDPPRVSDRTSSMVNAHIFESPLSYDPLAPGAKLIPLTAAALPEVSADQRRFVFTLKPGIFFSPDPAFGGRPRELVAEDYVYSIKRYYDPRIPTEHLYQFENAKILGLAELRKAALAGKRGLDYDAPCEGLRALDRYRFQVLLAEPDPRFVLLFASTTFSAALAREVVERYGEDIGAHPVGTGPFVLKDWRRGSRVLLARSPSYREHRYDAEPAADDAEGLALLARLKGRRLPMLDEIELAIILEEQPRWLAFHGGDIDALEMPPKMAPVVVPKGQLLPALARRGVQARFTLDASVRHTFFNQDDAHLGGLQPARVALRRAIALAYDNLLELRHAHGGQGLPAQSMVVPGVYGYDPLLKGDFGRGELARARALLDTFGYRDRDGDGWREHPDGSPLRLRLAGLNDSRQRAINEVWEKQMRLLGLHIDFELGQFGELIKNALAGRLQMWSYAWTSTMPDADFFLGLAYGPNSGQSNDARFRMPLYDRAYERQRAMPDGPERLSAMREAQRLQLAYMPYLPHFHGLRVDLTHAHVLGYRRHRFARDWWRYVDVQGSP
ncbi:MAG: bicyclomycin resistance protein [Burkholderiales bacterium]|nr:bicyclomycin resistance protein [Burkholderiales bacterium]